MHQEPPHKDKLQSFFGTHGTMDIFMTENTDMKTTSLY